MNPHAAKSNHSKHRTYRARQKWLKHNRPDDKGNYICGICKKPVHISELTLDHILERVFLKYDYEYNRLWNLQAAHKKCNSDKNKAFTKRHRLALSERQSKLLRRSP